MSGKATRTSRRSVIKAGALGAAALGGGAVRAGEAAPARLSVEVPAQGLQVMVEVRVTAECVVVEHFASLSRHQVSRCRETITHIS